MIRNERGQSKGVRGGRLESCGCVGTGKCGLDKETRERDV